MDQTECHQGLYRPEFEHDSCGTGFIVNIDGHKTNQIIDDALVRLVERATPSKLVALTRRVRERVRNHG